MTNLAADWGTGQVFLSMIYFYLFFVWVWLVITVFADIFRSRDMSGWGKAMWSIFVIVLPFLGVMVYLIARGGKMHERAIAMAERNDLAQRDYIRNVAAASPADEVQHLADLRSEGVINDAEFEALKAKVAV